MLEEDDIIEDPVVDGVTFNVKYLGSCSMETDCGEEATSEAIKQILDKAKERNKKLNRVCINISERGIVVRSSNNEENKDIDMDIKINRFKIN